MTVREVKTGLSDQVATLAVPEADQVIGSMKRFGGDGAPLQWSGPQRLEPLAEKRRTPKPFGDISPFLPGTLVLSTRAYEALGPFLSKFGQLLELDVAGQQADQNQGHPIVRATRSGGRAAWSATIRQPDSMRKFVAVRRSEGGGINYALTLETTASAADEDAKTFERLAHDLKFVALAH